MCAVSISLVNLIGPTAKIRASNLLVELFKTARERLLHIRIRNSSDGRNDVVTIAVVGGCQSESSVMFGAVCENSELSAMFIK